MERHSLSRSHVQLFIESSVLICLRRQFRNDHVDHWLLNKATCAICSGRDSRLHQEIPDGTSSNDDQDYEDSNQIRDSPGKQNLFVRPFKVETIIQLLTTHRRRCQAG